MNPGCRAALFELRGQLRTNKNVVSSAFTFFCSLLLDSETLFGLFWFHGNALKSTAKTPERSCRLKNEAEPFFLPPSYMAFSGSIRWISTSIEVPCNQRIWLSQNASAENCFPWRYIRTKKRTKNRKLRTLHHDKKNRRTNKRKLRKARTRNGRLLPVKAQTATVVFSLSRNVWHFKFRGGMTYLQKKRARSKERPSMEALNASRVSLPKIPREKRTSSLRASRVHRQPHFFRDHFAVVHP